jgi:hypothetical protein
MRVFIQRTGKRGQQIKRQTDWIVIFETLTEPGSLLVDFILYYRPVSLQQRKVGAWLANQGEEIADVSPTNHLEVSPNAALFITAF